MNDHRIKLITESDSLFVKENGFILPVCDCPVRFNLDAAMLAIGGRKISKNEWNIPIELPHLAEYLLAVQEAVIAGAGPKDAMIRWVKRFCMRNAVEQLNFKGVDVDWSELQSTFEQIVSKNFPLCA